MSADYAAPIGMDPEPSHCLGSRRLVGDPIDVVSGANIDVTVDVRVHGPLQLRWRRYYNSARRLVPCALGWGHAHDFERTLTHDLDGLHYTDPLGTEVPFPALAIGASSARSGLTLSRIEKDVYHILSVAGPLQEFVFDSVRHTAPLRRLRQADDQIDFRYDVHGRLTQIIDSLSRSIAVEWTESGRVSRLSFEDDRASGTRQLLLQYEYDPAGNLIAGLDRYKTTFGFEWDTANCMTRRTDRRGYSFHFSYDQEGRCVHSRGDDGLLEVWLDYRREFRTTYVRRGDGGEWAYRFDGAGNIVEVVDPYGGSSRFAVDEIGRVTDEVDPNGNVTRLLYDASGHHHARLDPLGYILPPLAEDPNPPDPLAYELPETPLEWEHGQLLTPDEIGRIGADDDAFRDLPPNVRDAFLDAHRRRDRSEPQSSLSGGPEQPRRDEQGRLVEEGPSPRPQRWKYDPNGNVAEHQDRDGATYRYRYRSWNAKHEEIDPLGHTTVFGQSVQGLVNRVEDPGGTVTDYVYDLKDRVTEVFQNGALREAYTYDAAGNVVEKMDPHGHVLVSWTIGLASLDIARRLSSGETHTFKHDARGRIVEASTATGTATFGFSDDGERLEDKRDGVGVAHEFGGGTLVATTVFDRFRTTYAVDDGGAVVVTDPTGAKHHIAVRAPGVVARRLANGTTEFSSYDQTGRCRGKALARDRWQATPWVRSFSYSAAGDLKTVTDGEVGTVRYRYDAGHRIAEEVLPDGTRRPFAFDSAGNLLSQPGLAGVQMSSCNRLGGANGDRFEYDDRDRLRVREGRSGTTRYEYDALDMLVACDIDGVPWTASYDALCRRIRKTWGGQTTRFYWDDFRLIAELRHDGSVRIYVYEDQVALVPFMFVEYPTVESEQASGARSYIFTNQIGAPIRVENDEGQVSWSARIDPFGRTHIDPASSVDMPLRFPGHYCDGETGLHCNRFRYYSPELGRYLQLDPAGLEGGINLYSYPTDPLTDVDLDGLKPSGGGAKSRSGGRTAPGTPKGANANCPATAGAAQAEKLGYPPAPKGYHWADTGGNTPTLKVNPNSGKPPKIYNPETGKFQKKPPESLYPRHKFTDPEREKVFDQSRPDENKKPRCPVCNKTVKSPDAADMDVGHKPEHQFAPRQQQAIANKEDPAAFKKDEADLSHYRAEHPGCNRSHKGEKVQDDE